MHQMFLERLPGAMQASRLLRHVSNKVTKIGRVNLRENCTIFEAVRHRGWWGISSEVL